MEPNDFATVVNTLLKILSETAPRVYDIAHQQATVRVWRELMISFLFFLPSLIITLKCYLHYVRPEQTLDSSADTGNYYNRYSLGLTITSASITLLLLVVTLANAINLFCIDYLAIEQIIQLIPR